MNTHFIKLENGSIAEIDTHKFDIPYHNTSYYWGVFCGILIGHGDSEESAIKHLITNNKDL